MAEQDTFSQGGQARVFFFNLALFFSLSITYRTQRRGSPGDRVRCALTDNAGGISLAGRLAV